MASRLEREESLLKCHGRAWTIWFTGLSGSGKSTLARALAEYLDRLSLAYELIDGDEIRRELCKDLGFSKEDRDENVRRIGYVAQLLNRHDVIAIVAAISPYRQARKQVRQKSSCFIEVHVDCPLATLTERDVKGLFQRALKGEIPYFSGVSDPYEKPIEPEIYINSGTQTRAESFSILVARLEELGCLPSQQLEAQSRPA
jgi:adenylylsulfate kinase